MTAIIPTGRVRSAPHTYIRKTDNKFPGCPYLHKESSELTKKDQDQQDDLPISAFIFQIIWGIVVKSDII